MTNIQQVNKKSINSLKAFRATDIMTVKFNKICHKPNLNM